MCASDDKLNITYGIVTGFFVDCFDKTDVLETSELTSGFVLTCAPATGGCCSLLEVIGTESTCV